jgi:hypothetical protein
MGIALLFCFFYFHKKETLKINCPCFSLIRPIILLVLISESVISINNTVSAKQADLKKYAPRNTDTISGSVLTTNQNYSKAKHMLNISKGLAD